MNINELINSGALGDFEMSFSGKDLTSLEGLEKFTFVTSLNLSNNKNLKSLKGIEKLTNLKKLVMHVAQIESLELLEYLEKLEVLEVSFCNIKSLKGLENLTLLTTVNVYANKLNSLEFLPSSIKKLDCGGNESLSDVLELLKFKDISLDIFNTPSNKKFIEFANRKNLKYNFSGNYNKAEYKKIFIPLLKAYELEKHLEPGDDKRGTASLSETGLFDFKN